MTTNFETASNHNCNAKGGGMSDRSLIFNARGAQIGYIEGDRAFDLTGRERCNYARATGIIAGSIGG
jgi:hypothetical protein